MCEEVYEDDCHTEFTEECKETFEEMCKTEFVTECKQEYEEICDTEYSKQCKTEYTQVYPNSGTTVTALLLLVLLSTTPTISSRSVLYTPTAKWSRKRLVLQRERPASLDLVSIRTNG